MPLINSMSFELGHALAFQHLFYVLIALENTSLEAQSSRQNRPWKHIRALVFLKNFSKINVFSLSSSQVLYDFQKLFACKLHFAQIFLNTTNKIFYKTIFWQL